jgi:hypothetical protein
MIALFKPSSVAASLGVALTLCASQPVRAAEPLSPRAAAPNSRIFARGDCGPYGHRGPWGGCMPGGQMGAGNYYTLGPPYYGPRPYYGPPSYAPTPDRLGQADYGPRYWGSQPYGINAFQ